MKIQSAITLAAMVAVIGAVASFVIAPAPAQSTEAFTPEQLFSAGEITALPELDCHQGVAHLGSGIELDDYACYCQGTQMICTCVEGTNCDPNNPTA